MTKVNTLKSFGAFPALGSLKVVQDNPSGNINPEVAGNYKALISRL